MKYHLVPQKLRVHRPPSASDSRRMTLAPWLPRPLIRALLASLAGMALCISCEADQRQSTRARVIPAPAVDEEPSGTGTNTETAVLAGGCFWGVQSVYNRVKGVERTVAGYSGGTKETANYRAVSSETTQHA